MLNNLELVSDKILFSSNLSVFIHNQFNAS